MEVAERFWSKVGFGEPDDCWLWMAGRFPEGYGRFKIGNSNIPAQRVSYWLTHGEWPLPLCLHSCDNPPCVNPTHLRAGTHAENAADRVTRGRSRHQAGEDHGRHKLTRNEVVELRSRYPAETLTALAAEYGVSSSQVSNIVNNLQWKEN